MTDKSQRFRETKDSCSDIGNSVMSKSSSMGELRTPIKPNMSMQVKGIERRRNASSVSTPRHQAENGKIKQLEAKIKNLLLQETEMGRRLQQAQEKTEKLDGKLQSAYKEKAQLQAHLAKLEKQILELSRSKDVLMNKVVNLEGTHSRHASTSEELDAAKLQLRKKEKELEQITMELNNKVNSLQADLAAAHTNIKALQEARKALEQTNQEMRDHGEVIEEEIRQLQAVTDCLREENVRLQDNLSSAIIQQESTERMIERVKCSLLETESRLDVSIANVDILELAKSEMGENLSHAESTISSLREGEVHLKSQLSELQIQFEEETKHRKDAQEKVENLEEELERTETSTTESLRQMSNKYQTLETILAQAEADLTWEADTHKAQLAAAEAISQQRAAECKTLQIQNRDLIHAYNVEKEECDLLREQLEELTTEDKEDLEMIGDRLDKQEKDGEVIKEICSDLGEHLKDMKQEKTKVEDHVQALELKAQKDQHMFEQEKGQLSTALQSQKKQVCFLEKQLEELGNEIEEEMEEVTGLDERLQLQEDEICSIRAINVQLQTKLDEMREEKDKLMASLQSVEEAREMDKQNHAKDKEILCDELNIEKERVDALEVQLTELSNDFEELSNIENRLAKQEGTAEDIKMDKDRLSSMLKLAQDRQISAEQAFDQARSEQKAVQMSLEEQQQLSASLESSLKITQKAKESLMTQVELLQAAKKKLSADSLAGQQNIHRLECEATSAKQESTTLREQVSNIETTWKSKVQDLEEACSHQRAEFGRRLVDTQTKLSQSEAERRKAREDHEVKTSQIRERLEERIDDLEQRLHQLQTERENHQCLDETAVEILQTESQSWKLQFEELMEKVAPFKDQLNQFEIDRRMLLSQNDAAQSEVNKLSNDYAKLLGHQNQKQKIHHIMKIKDENASLKKEVTKLREETTKQSRNLRQMKDKVEKMEGKKKFDPTSAFRHGKENQTQPLTQRN